jgi:hypothetical protein
MTTTTAALIDWQPSQTARHNGHVVTLLTFPTSAGYSPARLGHRCHLGADCRRWDVDGGTGFAWECELTPALTEGQQVSRNVGDGRYVRITCTRVGAAYHVDIVAPGAIAGVVETTDREWSGESETEAREYGNQLVDGLREQANTADVPATTPRVTGRPVAKGHQLDMSPSQARAIVAAGIDGHIQRGAPRYGRLTDTQIRALAAPERRWVTAVTHVEGRRIIIDGATVGERAYNAALEVLAKTNQTTSTAA